MEATHSKTLAIETGVACNNRCVFCYQSGYRRLPGFPRQLPADEVRARMRWGVDNGFDEVSFTGGEPTLRPDFLDLIRHARELGYRRVAVTTNGSMLARPPFFEAAVEAGLTSMGVSVHGCTPEVHDALTGRSGSFVRALHAIRNAVATRGSSAEVRLNTFTVVNRLNVERLVDLADLLSLLGVGLMVFQPTLLSKSNVEQASSVSLDLPDLIDAVKRVALRGAVRGFRSKLYNLPPCLFREAFAGLDLTQYARATFHEQDDRASDQGGDADPDGYVRLDACAACCLRGTCPGLHVTLLPQADLTDHIEACVDAVRPSPRGALWIAGTDLLRPDGIARVVGRARRSGFGEVAVTDGGTGVAGRNGLLAAQEAGAHRIILAHHARDAASSDRLVRHAGNDGRLGRVIADLLSLPDRDAIAVALLVNPGDAALSLLDRPDVRRLRSGPHALYVRAFWRDEMHDVDWRGARPFLDALVRTEWRASPLVIQVPRPSPVEAAAILPIVSVAARGRVRFDVRTVVLPTHLVERRFTVLNWSDPETGGWEPSCPRCPAAIPALSCRSLSVRPVAPRDLAP